MEMIHKRFLLFLIGCIGVRVLITYTAKHINNEYLPYLGYLAIIPTIGFTYIYLTDSRQTGGEVFGDKIWWNNLRPIHALLYGLFSYSAIYRQSNSWKFLMADVILGVISFLSHHYHAGSFNSF